jgi:hypothetical protein
MDDMSRGPTLTLLGDRWAPANIPFRTRDQTLRRPFSDRQRRQSIEILTESFAVVTYCIISTPSEIGPRWIVVEAADSHHAILKPYLSREQSEEVCARLNDAASERRLTFERTDRYFRANTNDPAQSRRAHAGAGARRVNVSALSAANSQSRRQEEAAD